QITGQYEESRGSYGQAIELLAELCAQDSSRLDSRQWLAQTFIDRGELYHMNGETDRSERGFQTAVAEAGKRLIAPISSYYRRVKASALIDLSEILLLKDQVAESRRAADQAVQLLGPLADPAEPSELTSNDRWLLAMALTDRGTALLEAHEQAAAL